MHCAWHTAEYQPFIYFASDAVAVDSSHTPLWSRFSPPSNLVNGRVSTTWFTVCRWPQSQEGDWTRPHLILWNCITKLVRVLKDIFSRCFHLYSCQSLVKAQYSRLLPTSSTIDYHSHWEVWDSYILDTVVKGKGSPYSTAKRRVPELIPVLGSQPAGNVSHKPGGRLPLPSARPAVTLATLKRAATIFAVWWTEARWVWTVCLRQAFAVCPTASWLWFEPRPYCTWVQHANHSATEPQQYKVNNNTSYSASKPGIQQMTKSALKS